MENAKYNSLLDEYAYYSAVLLYDEQRYGDSEFNELSNKLFEQLKKNIRKKFNERLDDNQVENLLKEYSNGIQLQRASGEVSAGTAASIYKYIN